MWTPSRIRARGTPASGRRRSTLRLQLETLEDRLAPHCTLPAVAQADLPFGIPVAACTADEPNAAPAAQIFTTDIAKLGLDGAVRLTVVFHFAGTSSSEPVLEYFDSAAGTWRAARASTEVPGASHVDAARGEITIVFDETSSPTLASLNGRMFRVGNTGTLTSLVIAAGTPVSAAAGQQPALPGDVSGFVPPSPLSSAPFTFDTRGALTPADHGIQPEVVFQTHAAFWNDPTAAEALDSGDLPVDPVPVPPIDPSADLPMMAWSTDEAAVAAALSHAASEQDSQHNAGAEHEEVQDFVLIPAPAVTREVIVERTVAKGGPARLVLAVVVFGWSSLRGPKLLDKVREGHDSRRQTSHPDRRPGPLWHARHSTTIARPPPRTRKRK